MKLLRKIAKVMVIILIPFLTACTFMSINTNKSDIKLYEAICYDDNVEAAREAIQDGANINEFSGKVRERTDNSTVERNPFRIACFLGKWGTAKLLIEEGADPNWIDADGNPIISYVLKSGNLELADLLLHKGADINLEGRNGLTPLESIFLRNSYGVGSSNREVSVENVYDFMITNGANLSEHTMAIALKGINDDGYCRYNLIQKIAGQLNEKGKATGLSPILESLILGDFGKFDKLIESAKITDNMVLYYAAAYGKSDSIQKLLDRGMDLHAIDNDMNSLLAIAARAGNNDTLMYLINKMDVSKNKNKYLPIEWAALNNHYESVKILLDNGAKLEFHEYIEGEDVLTNACINGNIEIVALLLDHGYPKEGYSQALYKAAENNQVQVIREILNRGVEVDAIINAETALSIASRRNNIETVKLLIENGADLNDKTTSLTPLVRTCSQGYTEVVDLLIQYGANVNENRLDSVYSTPLAKAIYRGSLDVIKLLVEHGAIVDQEILDVAKNAGSDTIYHYLQSVETN